MKVVILAGGKGTRISEYTKFIPKPMIKIKKYPLIFHIMKIYAKQGFKDFIIATGYKSEIIEKFFKKKIDDWSIKIVPTGLDTMTGGRIKRLKKYLNNERFFLTYGDGISNLNIKKLLNFHIKNKSTVTLTAVRPPARFGELIIIKDKVKSFKEKPQVSSGWINGGFFIANYSFLNFIRSDKEILEKWPLEKMTKINQLVAYKHKKFWKCMDVKRDRDELNNIYKKNKFNF